MQKLSLGLVLVLLGGCAVPVTPNYDTRFGDAVRQARQMMILNPTPSLEAMPGIDGRAATEAVSRYHDSFKAPPPVVNVINIGGAVGGGK